jgi:hypothetical protein
LLRYFRINDPYRLVGLLILLIILYLPLFLDPPDATYPELKNILVGEKINEGNKMYSEVVDTTAPLAAWFHGFMDMVFGRSLLARHILAFFILFFQSLFLGVMFIGKKVFNENTYIPSFVFSLLLFFSFDNLALTDELLGSGFLLIALRYLFTELEFRMQRDETTFNLGVFVSLASLFYFPYFVFLFGIIIILFIFSRTDARKFLLLVFGFLLPHLLVLSLHYINNSLSKVWQYYYLSNLTIGENSLMSTKSLLIIASVPLFFLFIAVVMNRVARFSKYQSQLLLSMFMWVGFSFIFIIFSRDLRPQSFIIFMPAITFLLTNFLLVFRKKRFAEITTLLFFISTVAVCYAARYNKIEGVDYNRLLISTTSINNLPENKRILSLNNDITVYAKNKVATPYVNWKLSENIFRYPDYYENVTEVYRAFKQDAPALIIDKEDLLKPFFARMPELKKQYIRQGEFYIKRD